MDSGNNPGSDNVAPRDNEMQTRSGAKSVRKLSGSSLVSVVISVARSIRVAQSRSDADSFSIVRRFFVALLDGSMSKIKIFGLVMTPPGL